jgi:hypothetical protein
LKLRRKEKILTQSSQKRRRGRRDNRKRETAHIERSEELADSGVNLDVGGGIAADEVETAVVKGEFNEAADVVVLVEGGEELDRFFGVEGEGFEGDGLATLFGERGVAVDYFLETQHIGNAAGSARAIRAASGFCFAECIALAAPVEARRLAAAGGFGKMLEELKTHRRTCL